MSRTRTVCKKMICNWDDPGFPQEPALRVYDDLDTSCAHVLFATVNLRAIRPGAMHAHLHMFLCTCKNVEKNWA